MPFKKSIGIEEVLRGKRKSEENEVDEGEKEGLQREITMMKRFLDSVKGLFDTYAGDASLRFVPDSKFFIEYQTGTVHSDVRWFRKFAPEIREEAILWAHLHELTHFLEYAREPEALLGNFAYVEAKAKRLSPKVLEIWSKKSGGQLPDYMGKEIEISKEDGASSERITVGEYLARKVITEALWQFYNLFDDVAVNSLIRQRTSKFEEGSMGDSLVKRIYREQLFPLNDYSKFPFHLQLIYPYLREAMIPEERVKVLPRIKEIRRGISYLGEIYPTIAKFNEELIEGSKLRERYWRLQRTLEPIYLKLLFEDLKKAPLPKLVGEGKEEGTGKGAALPFDSDYKPYRKNSPDQFPKDDIEKWAREKKEEKDAGKKEAKRERKIDSKPVGDREREIREAMDKKWAQKYASDDPKRLYEELQRVRRIEEKIAPYLDEMSRFWRKIVFGFSTERELGWEGFFEHGKLDVGQVVRKWPEIVKGDPSQVRVMKRRVAKERLIHKPKVVRLRLVLDVSGSMAQQNKMEVLRKIAVLLGRSLEEFNHYLASAREETGTELVADLEEWTFESLPKLIKPLAGNDYRLRDWERDKVAFIRSISQLSSPAGSTADHLALEAINNSIGTDDVRKIKEGEVMEILIEITDGGSDDAEQTRKVKERLKKKGIIAKAFQIGLPGPYEVDRFKTAWENDGDGQRVPDLSKVLPVLTQFLEEHLQDIEI